MDRVQKSGSQFAVRSEQADPFKKLKVWRKAHELTLAIYLASRSFPREELYGYTSQIRRAAVSTPTNIVEGTRRRSPKDFRHFLNIAQSSNEEVKYLLFLGGELGYLSQADTIKLSAFADEVGAMIHVFAEQLQAASCELQTEL